MNIRECYSDLKCSKCGRESKLTHRDMAEVLIKHKCWRLRERWKCPDCGNVDVRRIGWKMVEDGKLIEREAK